nr:Ig-like domain-containing protein [uncultured Lacibacter sp.]
MTAGRIIFIFIIGALFISLFSGSGCANIVPPGGGPRDSLPPVPVSAIPKDSAIMVKEQKITIVFDEFIELKSVNENVIISPFPVKEPVIEQRLRSVTVRLKDSLLPNTTYNINFGNAIVDLNEGNVLKNFQYTFSTGAVIDSNELSGKVILAETGKTDSTMFALLYRKQEDSTVFKERPMYVARVDAQGNFHFHNLPAGEFYVYALLDEDGNKRYTQGIEQFAFLDSSITVSSTTPPVQLYAYAAEKERPKTSSSQQDKTKGLIAGNNIEGGAFDLLDTFRLSYNKPVKSFDQSKIRLVQDSTQNISNFSIVNDTSRKQLLLQYNWKAGSRYQLFLDKEYAKDTSGLTSLKNDTLSFRVRSEKEYGSLRIRFSELDTAAHPVLLFYNNDEIVVRYSLKGKEFFRPQFKPGSYKLGILFDTNQNGMWDPGDFYAKPRRQPELVLPLTTTVTVKENWDNELVIETGKQPANQQGKQQ